MATQTNRDLKQALLERLKVTPQRLSQRVRKMKEDHGPMTSPDATYVIAHQAGLDLTKYIDTQTVDRVRDLIPEKHSLPSRITHNARRTPTQVSITVTGSLPKVDALLTVSIVKDAQEMARLYPIYYVLENSIREVIRRILSKAHGKDWWATQAPPNVQKRVTNRKAKEKRSPWHGRRGSHEIFYSDFGDLRAIIEKNWSDFTSFFPTRPWITNRLDELEHPRNILAHHNPLSKNDRKRLELYFEDWVSLLASKRDLLQ